MAKGIRKKILLDLYAMMLKIRLFEERIVGLYPKQEMRTPVHLYIGEEAIAAGVCKCLKNDDLIFTTHRCHGHCIAKGMALSVIMAELYGKKTGCCRGKGGSMHLADPNHGILATSAIVGGGIPIAVGSALSFKYRKKKNVVVSFFGDGAVDEGIFYESLNFAALKKLPILFVCENNFYATNSPLRARQPLDNIFEKGRVFGIAGYRCDGNDAIKVMSITSRLIGGIRKGSGPYLLECRTYRWKGHVGPDCDIENGCRPQYEMEKWMRRCPIRKLERLLVKSGPLDSGKIAKIRDGIEKEIDSAYAYAKSSPPPGPGDVYEDVYYKES